MYKAIVERTARRNFQRVNDKDYGPFLAACAPDVRHSFGGDHALGGVRNSREALGRWFDRLGRVAPTLRLTVTDVWVTGTPFTTTVMVVRWTARADLPDGSEYRNHGVHIVRLRRGKVIEIDANEDSQAVVRMLDVWAAAGVTEAAAEPILS
jgi:ketosteroid isomerase-like protein